MKTAVDFYHDALLELERKWQTKEIVTFSQWRDMYINAYKQAKQMEKEQIKDAYLNGRYEADKIVMGHSFYAKQYYNETFKQQEQ
jgi:hypothetical protein